MKLKKIASLMLAGVMAVSMLAGCNTNAVDPEDPTDPETPVVIEGDISAGVESYIANKLSYVEFEGDNDLTNALDYIVEFADVEDIVNGFFTSSKPGPWGHDELIAVNRNDNMQERLETRVGATNVTVSSIGKMSTLVEAEKASTVSIADAKAVQLYVASGVIGENALNTLVAEAIEDYVTDGDDDAYLNVVEMNGHNGLYDHNYTVSVSTGAKSVNGYEVTFVAVQVVRSSVRS